MTIYFDILLLVVVAFWYMGATQSAPSVPDPEAGLIYAVPVLTSKGVHFASCNRWCHGASSFHTGFVGVGVFTVFCICAVNWGLFLLAGVWSFFKQL